jgi:ABC-type lipoprotein export system ATPase subunit
VSEAAVIDLRLGFKTFTERVRGERADRLKYAAETMSFGVRFLDKALGGIMRNDLIILGAKTGIGKTELATIIAGVNAARGKHVHYFALEAEDREIERRTKFKLLSQMVRQFNYSGVLRMNYLDWHAGKLEDLTEPHEGRIETLLAEKFGTLHTYYRNGQFDSDELERLALAIQDQTSLIVIDHLHYVDSTDPNENRGYKVIVKRIRDLALSIGKPVIVVAHVRKGDRRQLQLVPDLEDFHGTSDVPKIATKAIMLAPAFDHPGEESHLWNTYVAPRKCRADGSRTRYIGMVQYNARTGAYEDGFTLGRTDPSGEKWTELDAADYPLWAKVD